MNAATHLSDAELSYTLAKQIPAMDSGFVIQTVYGDIHVAAGHLAILLTNLVGQEFRLEHARREARAYDAQGARREARPHERDGLGFRFDAPVIGEQIDTWGEALAAAIPARSPVIGDSGCASRPPAADAGCERHQVPAPCGAGCGAQSPAVACLAQQPPNCATGESA